MTDAPAPCNSPTASSLFPLVYDQLREIARVYLSRERRGHTLQPTALVHEAYLKLADQNRVQWQGKSHFLAVAATAMRRILVNHAKAHRALKRGGDLARLALDEALTEAQERSGDLIALDEALGELEHIDTEQVRIVELRFFGGLTALEAAEVLGISERTVFRQWLMARAWLKRWMTGRSEP
jgi:RNA polymerase sigma-70 factor (ECF subfamily)